MKVEYLQGAPLFVEPFTLTKVIGSLHGGGLVCPLQLSLIAVLYTPAMVWAVFFLPWGKGLNRSWPNTIHTFHSKIVWFICNKRIFQYIFCNVISPPVHSQLVKRKLIVWRDFLLRAFFGEILQKFLENLILKLLFL